MSVCVGVKEKKVEKTNKKTNERIERIGRCVWVAKRKGLKRLMGGCHPHTPTHPDRREEV